jgi:branched-chain amino acid aminotransferase
MDLAGLTVYADGRFVRYDEAKVGLLTHGLQYGTGCFEGIRGFWSAADDELYLLHVREHYERLAQSAKILMIKLPHSVDELTELTVDLVARNEFRSDIYLRPCTFKANEDVGVRLHDVKDSFAIIAIPFSKYFDATAGLKCGTSSWRRIDDTSAPARGKITGTYVNSALAKSEAILNGFDEAIMLSHDGHVAEGSAENLFIIKNGQLITPDPSQNILEGITRRTVLTLAQRELGLTVIERSIDRSEVFGAEEMFLSGSAAGVQWIQSVTRGQLPQYRDWLIPTYATRKIGV